MCFLKENDKIYINVNGEKNFFFCIYLFSCFMFLQDVFTNVFHCFNGRGEHFMTGDYLCQPGGRCWCVLFPWATVAFFVVVLLLLSLNAMFSFHRYCHSNNKNEIKWLKNTKKIARNLTSRFTTKIYIHLKQHKILLSQCIVNLFFQIHTHIHLSETLKGAAYLFKETKKSKI